MKLIRADDLGVDNNLSPVGVGQVQPADGSFVGRYEHVDGRIAVAVCKGRDSAFLFALMTEVCQVSSQPVSTGLTINVLALMPSSPYRLGV